MTSQALVLEMMRKMGKETAQALQEAAPDMTATEIVAEQDFIPDFNPERQYLNYPVGYLCKTALGNVCKLVQLYDSQIYTAQPEELPAQWGFQWSTDPAMATDFIALSTSPYAVGDCCIYDGMTYRSLTANNVNSPEDYPTGWEIVNFEEE